MNLPAMHCLSFAGSASERSRARGLSADSWLMLRFGVDAHGHERSVILRSRAKPGDEGSPPRATGLAGDPSARLRRASG